jgi:hypothetical protein
MGVSDFGNPPEQGYNLMLVLPPTSDLSLRGAADRGIPNKERILIYSFPEINLMNFILGIGYTAGGEFVTPFRQYVYYFDSVIVPANSWIVVYTGAGQTQVSRLPPPGNDIAFIYHWGLPAVVFQQPEVVPILFRISEMNFAPKEQPFLFEPFKITNSPSPLEDRPV